MKEKTRGIRLLITRINSLRSSTTTYQFGRARARKKFDHPLLPTLANQEEKGSFVCAHSARDQRTCDRNPCWHSHRLDWANENVLISIIFSSRFEQLPIRETTKRSWPSRLSISCQGVNFNPNAPPHTSRFPSEQTAPYLIGRSRVVEHVHRVKLVPHRLRPMSETRRQFNWLLILVSNKLAVDHCLRTRRRKRRRRKRLERVDRCRRPFTGTARYLYLTTC
jgi:hypothetical protein